MTTPQQTLPRSSEKTTKSGKGKRDKKDGKRKDAKRRGAAADFADVGASAKSKEKKSRGGGKPKGKEKKSGKQRKGKRRAVDPRFTAATADKHDLYQLSVQAPEIDSEFFYDYVKSYTKRAPRWFREDFCGTFVLSSHFVKLHRDNHAICVDLDGPTLDWGREHNLAQLSAKEQQRIHIYQRDVLELCEPKADVIAAMNFSYCIFKTRELMQRYFDNCYRSLNDGGVLMLDIWGGSETQELMEEPREIEQGFTYVWDQFAFDPLTYHSVCKIHFKFADRTKMRDAFVYDWRMWTAPELHEMMVAAGFEDVHFLWDMSDNDDENDYQRCDHGEPDTAWIAYLVGRRG
ncbi:MAG: class I SAM-dependent methyltransferase [Planctomycetes bacterium]|nr:class I SAM-dependent methyltransferase [Planctomycetota bacterium]MCB9869432.1 class I SAM-dependent methyltransferase [Planctomycetota bacterium]MCB9888510.1 class I SAM-dependent methyltransferase [Planctomycetota bacterium]